MSVHEMDRMGAHSDEGVSWFPKSLFPTRGKVKVHFCHEFAHPVDFISLRVRSEYMRHAPEECPEAYDDWWVICDRDAPGAFPVWRVE